jgi:hypothetical protein
MKVNYVVACWAGDRRKTDDTYHYDKSFYLRMQVRALSKYKNNLSQITFVIADCEDEAEEFSQAVKQLPTKIQNTPVTVLRRENNGQSYGSYSHCFAKYREEFDYYIFIEDDYVIVQDNFDEILVNMYRAKSDCGYLCSLVFSSTPYPHAAISNGIAHSEVLEKIWHKFGEIPYGKKEGFTYNSDPQLMFSFAFWEVGYRICDTLDEYRSLYHRWDNKPINYGDFNKPDLIMPVQFYASQEQYLKPYRLPPLRTPMAVADAIKDLIQDKIVCELGCAEGDNLVFMSKYAKSVFGIEYMPHRFQVAKQRGLNVMVGDYYRLEQFPAADVYYYWPDDGEKDNEYLLEKIMNQEDFEGTVIIGGDPGFSSEIPSVMRCAKKGRLLKVPYNEGEGHRQNGVFYVAVISKESYEKSNTDTK